MGKKLVAYFSASNVTKRAAGLLAKAAEADLFEIVPQEIYTKEDLDWTNPNSRSSVEMKDLDARPAILSGIDTSIYDTVFLGFPVWWGREPSVVDTFIDSCDLKDKNIVVFCTSGAGGAEGAMVRIGELTGKPVSQGARLAADASEEEIADWYKGLAL